MPYTAAQPVRSRNPVRRGNHAGSSRQRVDPRQKTLTQIDFVTRLFSPSSEQDLEYEHGLDVEPSTELDQDYEQEEITRPRKRRRHDARASLSPQPRSVEASLDKTAIQTKSHSSPGPVNAGLGLSQPGPPAQISPQPHPPRSGIARASAQVSNDRTLMPPPGLPKTPNRQRRTYVPSSQSPELTPLTIRSSQNVPEPQRSPLNVRSTNSAIRRSHRGLNGVEKKPNPFMRFRVADSYGSDLEEGDGLGEGGGNDTDRPVSRLQFGNPQTPKAGLRSRRLEASPDVRRPEPGEVIYVEDSSQVEPVQPELATQSRRGLGSRTHTQQTFSGPAAPVQHKYLGMSRTATELEANSNFTQDFAKKPMTTQVPSSQATTQLPTQYYDRTQGYPNAEPDAESDTEPDLPTVRGLTSSQATTVVPSSSNPASGTVPRPRRGKGGELREYSQYEKDEKGSVSYDVPEMLTTSQALDGWEWDGNDWTDSQLLPPALMNFPLPGLPPASQGSIGSLHEAENENENENENEEGDDVGLQALKSNVLEQTDERGSAGQPPSMLENTPSVYAAIEIKSEPSVAESAAVPAANKSEKRTYGRSEEGSRKRIKDELNE